MCSSGSPVCFEAYMINSQPNLYVELSWYVLKCWFPSFLTVWNIEKQHLSRYINHEYALRLDLFLFSVWPGVQCGTHTFCCDVPVYWAMLTCTRIVLSQSINNPDIELCIMCIFAPCILYVNDDFNIKCKYIALQVHASPLLCFQFLTELSRNLYCLTCLKKTFWLLNVLWNPLERARKG